MRIYRSDRWLISQAIKVLKQSRERERGGGRESRSPHHTEVRAEIRCRSEIVTNRCHRRKVSNNEAEDEDEDKETRTSPKGETPMTSGVQWTMFAVRARLYKCKSGPNTWNRFRANNRILGSGANETVSPSQKGEGEWRRKGDEGKGTRCAGRGMRRAGVRRSVVA